MDFPRLRFEQAGATPDEAGRLQAAFDASTPGAQQSYLERLAEISNYDLTDELIAGRGQAADEDLAGEEELGEPGPGPEAGDDGDDPAEDQAASKAGSPPGK